MATMETWKRQILSHNSNGCKEEKMLLQKHESYIFKLPVEKWVYWISARQKKMFQYENCTFWEKKNKSWKAKQFYILWQPSTTLFLKYKLAKLQGCLSPSWKLEKCEWCIEFVWLLFLTQSNYLEHQKLVILNFKYVRKMFVTTSRNKSIVLHGYEVCSRNTFSYTKFKHLR